jgi:hypothetical protein
MAGAIEIPKLEGERREMTMFRTPFPAPAARRVTRLARAFSLEGTPRDEGYQVSIERRGTLLEVFAASDSLRWTRAERAQAEPPRRVPLPAEDEARRLATTFLRRRRLHHERATLASVTFTEFARLTPREREPVTYPIALHVNFAFELDGLPLLGPGAKIQVTFGARKEVQQVLRYWREPVEDRSLPVLRSGEAAELLRRAVAPDGVPDGVRIAFEPPRLGYFALPPREAQRYLIPAYEFTGSVVRRDETRFGFVRHVVAVKVDPDELKPIGAVFRGGAPVF